MRDKVEREIVIRAPIERAFAALTDPSLFPTWGPERVEGTIAPGERPILDFGHGGRTAVYVVAVDPPRYFAYRWMQGVTDPVALLGDPLQGPNTLVEFHLEVVEAGTRVRVVESGISALPQMAGVDPDQAIENMGAGWRLMLGGLARSFEMPEVGDQLTVEVEIAAPAARIREALEAPDAWWFGRPPVEALGPLAFRWNAHGVPTVVELAVEDAPRGACVRATERGFDAAPDPAAAFKRAYQAMGIILGLLAAHVAKS